MSGVEWYILLTLNPRVEGLNLSLVLTSIGKALNQMCHNLLSGNSGGSAPWTPPPAPPPPPPHSVLFRVRVCSFPLFESTPYLRTANLSEPPLSRAFPALETPLNTEKCSMYPPKFGIISQESKEMKEKKKNTLFLKKSPGSNTPHFLQFSGRTLSHEDYAFTGHFGNTHAVIPTPEWGGGGGRDPT